jgi:hypothetical protein
MADGDDLYIRVTETGFFGFFPLHHLHFEVKIRNPTNKISVALVSNCLHANCRFLLEVYHFDKEVATHIVLHGRIAMRAFVGCQTH